MIRQKSFESNVSTLYLVPTPIGNLQEMTPRALDILKEVSVIAAEDTRNTKKLLMSYGIDTMLMSHHEHNQQVSIPKIIERLENGENVAVVSDAGYPLVSDPGQKLVQETISHGFNVVSVSFKPGIFANANISFVPSFTILPDSHFTFENLPVLIFNIPPAK